MLVFLVNCLIQQSVCWCVLCLPACVELGALGSIIKFVRASFVPLFNMRIMHLQSIALRRYSSSVMMAV